MSPSPSQTQPSPPNPAPSPPKKTPQPPTIWTHEETVNLIQAYQEKWYSLKRGQLKSSNWDEVAATVADRLGRLPNPTKSPAQCRHKLEKLRKRFRAEKQKIPQSLSWIYFPLMDRLDRGLPAAAAEPPEVVEILDDDDDDVDVDVVRVSQGSSRQNYYYSGQRGGDGGGDLMSERMKRRRRSGGGGGWSGGDRGGCAVAREMASEMKEFVERFVRMEKKKMEMMRENERFKMEMENKRLQMILVSHHKTADFISKTFGVKNTQDL